MSDWYVYITDKRGKFYVGVTTDLENRMRQHGVTRRLSASIRKYCDVF